METWPIVFTILAIIAAIVLATGIAGSASAWTWILLFVFLAATLIVLAMGHRREPD